MFFLQNKNNHRDAVAYRGAILRKELILGKRSCEKLLVWKIKTIQEAQTRNNKTRKV